MVRIIDYKQRVNSDNEKFFSLIIQSGLEMVKSKESGQYYATAKRTSITSTFDEETCKSLLGSEIPGSIKKVECEPYEYAIPESGEIVNLSHRWVYVPEGENLEENVFEGKPEGHQIEEEAKIAVNDDVDY